MCVAQICVIYMRMKPSLLRIGLLALSIIGISLLHYLTPLHLPFLHDIFQRLYYVPIILAAMETEVGHGTTVTVRLPMNNGEPK